MSWSGIVCIQQMQFWSSKYKSDQMIKNIVIWSFIRINSKNPVIWKFQSTISSNYVQNNSQISSKSNSKPIHLFTINSFSHPHFVYFNILLLLFICLFSSILSFPINSSRDWTPNVHKIIIKKWRSLQKSNNENDHQKGIKRIYTGT